MKRTIRTSLAALLVFAIIGAFGSKAFATIEGMNFFVFPVQDQQLGGIKAYLKGASYDGYGSMPLAASLQAAFSAVTTRALGAQRFEDGRLISSKRMNVNALKGIKIEASEDYQNGKMVVEAKLDIGRLLRDVKTGRIDRHEATTKVKAAVVSAVETGRLYSKYDRKAEMRLSIPGLEKLEQTASGVRVPAKPRKAYSLKKSDKRVRSFRAQSRRAIW